MHAHEHTHTHIHTLYISNKKNKCSKEIFNELPNKLYPKIKFKYGKDINNKIIYVNMTITKNNQ